MSEKGLGKGPGAGLGALFGGEFARGDENAVVTLPISKIEPRQEQPRTNFDEVSLNELAESLKIYGLIQPITVRKLDSGYYQIIAGERRWRAAKIAGLDEIPVRVLTADDKLAVEIALVENLQREDLNPVEESKGYRTLMTEYGLTQEEVSKSVGKARSTVANSLRLLALEEEVLKMLEEGLISPGHARALLTIRDPESQVSVAKKIIAQGLTVRQAETLASRLGKIKSESEIEPIDKINYTVEMEKELSERLGRRVKIAGNEKKGKIEIEFYGAEDMDALIKAIASLGREKEGYSVW